MGHCAAICSFFAKRPQSVVVTLNQNNLSLKVPSGEILVANGIRDPKETNGDCYPNICNPSGVLCTSL